MSTDGSGYDAFTDTLDLDGINSEDDLRGYDYPKEGNYHLVVASVDDSREKVNAIKVEFQVLAGDHPTEVGKTFTDTLWDPDPSLKSDPEFAWKYRAAQKRQAAFALATGLLGREQLSQQQSVPIKWRSAEGRQLVARVVNYDRVGKNDGKRYQGAQIDGPKMYAVNAQEAQAVPKNAEALALMGMAAAPAAVATPTTPTTPLSQTQPQQSAADPSNPWANLM